ncbi:MAG TPA: UDP-N-acetylmuramoyl-L-alanine--D-glutamate ligase [Patescibacteria group bacterium]|nr:UDP-N-acetylmuramoyl-L-alanine--D-glutamate ligase [Patescibacteria group bacterium]
MKTADFKNKKIAVLGLGLEGLSSVNFFSRKGALISVFDRKEKKEVDANFLKALEKLKAEFYGGENYLDNLLNFDLIVRSPGVKIPDEALEKLNKRGVEITSQTKLFFDLSPAKIIGVTGTKGKGTTSALIYEMLLKQGLDAYLIGNIGKPALEVLNKLNEHSIVVYELSSFQLLDLNKSPHIAVFLMTTKEHLNYHKNIEEYIDAKRNILRFQESSDLAIVNRDYPASNESDVFTKGKVFQVSREQGLLTDGIFVKDEAIFLKKNEEDKKLIDIKDVLLPGKHNLENICAASITAMLSGVNDKNIITILKSFKGLEHRLELIDTIKGVKYYDDSFSTTPETAIAAIEAFNDPEILILGGSSKNSDFSELGKVISEKENIKAIIGIGEEWKKIKEDILNLGAKTVLIEGAETMEKIVKAVSKIAETGDIVLLTPACASFGMFRNYKERGEQFKNEVRKLRMEMN